MTIASVNQLYKLMPFIAIGVLSFIGTPLSNYMTVSISAYSRLAQIMVQRTSSNHSIPHKYHIQVVSQDPFVVYVHDFLSKEEIAHFRKTSDGKFEASHVYRGDEQFVDTKSRISESAVLPFDDVTNRIEQRALDFRGWRNSSSVEIEDMKVQRYPVGGFYTYHYDWDPHVSEGNRVATFMVYLNDDLTGGGTNFPTLSKPSDKRWCRVIDCEDLVYPGVTFKPVAGSAVFWENMHTNGSFHRGVRHAALPVKEGVKWGLNVWFWDFDWRPDIEL